MAKKNTKARKKRRIEKATVERIDALLQPSKASKDDHERPNNAQTRP